MVEYKIYFDKHTERDKRLLESAGLLGKARQLVEVMKKNPYQNPPPYEKLQGNLQGLCSRRINRQHRLVYQVLDDEKIVRILSMWSHYESI